MELFGLKVSAEEIAVANRSFVCSMLLSRYAIFVLKVENELFSKHRKDYTWFYIMINEIKNNCLGIIF